MVDPLKNNTADTTDFTSKYDYDLNHRPTKVTDAAGHVKQTGGGSNESYVYDDNGNVISQTTGTSTTTSNYDRDRLQSTVVGGISSTYNYDPFDRTVSQIDDAGGSGEKTTVFDYLAMSNAVVDEQVDGKVTKSYQYSPWGERLSQVIHKPDGTEEPTYYTYNAHSDLQAVTDANGDTKSTYGYTAYGADDASQDTGVDKPGIGTPSSGAVEAERDTYESTLARWLHAPSHRRSVAAAHSLRPRLRRSSAIVRPPHFPFRVTGLTWSITLCHEPWSDLCSPFVSTLETREIRFPWRLTMAAQRDPYESPAIRGFAAELQAWRGEMSKTELAELLGYTPQLISQFEAGKNIPSKKFAEDADTFFKTNGVFARYWKLITDTRHVLALPPGFSKFVKLEAEAKSIRVFGLVLITGLLQTEEYAREIMLTIQQPDVVDQFVSSRMERQAILTREKPPRLWVTFDERALRTMIGSPEVMRGQLKHLLEASRNPNIMIDVVPQGADAYAGLGGSFTLLTFDNGPDVAYAEAAGHGHVVDDPAKISDFHVKYDLIRGHALPIAESRKLIESIAESL